MDRLTYVDKLQNYICLDLETTGLNPKMDKITEIGAVKVKEGKVVDTFSTLINPGRTLSERIVELTKITDEMLKPAPTIDKIIPDFLAFSEELPLLGHGILFDYSFMKRAVVNAGGQYERMGLDTLLIARTYLPDLESRRLTFLCKHYGIPLKAHRALEDALATKMLYDKLWEAFSEKEEGNKCFCPTKLLYKVKKESPATKQQKERLYKLIDRHKIIVDYDVESLTRNEASRYTDLILARYGR